MLYFFGKNYPLCIFDVAKSCFGCSIIWSSSGVYSVRKMEKKKTFFIRKVVLNIPIRPIHFSSDRYIMPPPKYLVHTKLLSKENYIVLKSIWASPKHYVCSFLQLPQITTMFSVSCLDFIPEKVMWTFLLPDMVCYIRFSHFLCSPKCEKAWRPNQLRCLLTISSIWRDSIFEIHSGWSSLLRKTVFIAALVIKRKFNRLKI